jgi:SAM-dependent MidA family methyltransferase
MERLYPKNQWITPSELFNPFFGFTLANFMVNQMENTGSEKVRILEIGPGTGSNADSILEFFKNYHLDLYKSCEYILVEISENLAN